MSTPPHRYTVLWSTRLAHCLIALLVLAPVLCVPAAFRQGLVLLAVLGLVLSLASWWLISQAFTWVEVTETGLRIRRWPFRPKEILWTSLTGIRLQNETAAVAGAALRVLIPSRSSTISRHTAVFLDRGFVRMPIVLRAHFEHQEDLVQEILRGYDLSSHGKL